MINLSHFENPKENIYFLKKWNWDYMEAEAFQRSCVDFVSVNPHISIFLVCSHQSCFTLGRGLQKLKENIEIDLVDYDSNSRLAYPLYQVKRGGGLTFHYPGQVVFYPIINLTYHRLAVHDFMNTIMKVAELTLFHQFNLQNINIRNDLLGLWVENKAKIASMGLAISRFNTYHGLALNFFKDQDMFNALEYLHPCGLPGNIYHNIESQTGNNLVSEDREIFTNSFLINLIKIFSKRFVEENLSHKI